MSLHKLFIFTIFVLAVFGLIMVASASGPRSQAEFGDSLHLFYRQFIYGFGLGLAGFLLCYYLPLSFLRKFILPLLFVSIVLLVLVFFPQFGGLHHAGSNRWLDVGPISFQPSEVAKLTLLLYCSAWLASHKKDITKFREGVLPFLLLSAPIPLLILLEPNISNFGITALLVFLLLYIAGARVSHMGALAGVALCLLLIAIVIFPTRMNRVLTFLDPHSDPMGTSYQINQSLISIGSGGIGGLGLGQSIQKRSLLPEPAGDAIFAVIGEELGFIGSGVVVAGYLLLVLLGIIIATRTRDLFGQYATIGFVCLISVQAFINISAVSGLMPLTGVTLPFISYGSTSLASLLAASGIIANIAKRT